MIITEELGDLVRHYSDSGYKVRQIETGILYVDAVDITPCPYTYEETNVRVEFGDPPENLNDSIEYLVAGELISVLQPEDEPDYLNENEQDPNYFN